MPTKATFKLCLLHARELRAASKSLVALHAADKETPRPADWAKMIQDTFWICMVALGDIDDDACIQVYEPREKLNA
jgi:hypothetical protein